MLNHLRQAGDVQLFNLTSPSTNTYRVLLSLWKGCIYIDTVLPFGLRSAPKIFNSIADGLEWVMKARGVHNVFHYLDDYIIMGSPKSTECGKDLEKALAVCSELGVPVRDLLHVFFLIDSPYHSQQLTVIWVNRHHAVCCLNIQLGQ